MKSCQFLVSFYSSFQRATWYSMVFKISPWELLTHTSLIFQQFARKYMKDNPYVIISKYMLKIYHYYKVNSRMSELLLLSKYCNSHLTRNYWIGRTTKQLTVNVHICQDLDAGLTKLYNHNSIYQMTSRLGVK